MNGQHGRQAIVRSLSAKLAFDCAVETGTYRGQTSIFLADVLGVPVHTVEMNKQYWYFCHWRFAGRDDIHLKLGDSRTFLRELRISSEDAVFVYLDAHWHDDLPLREELRIVSERWPRAVVMIDDFQVPRDDGYGFDDYGPSKRLSPEILPKSVRSWGHCYPSLPSSKESGAKRGCLVLLAPVYEVEEVCQGSGLELVHC